MRLREWFSWHFPELGKIVTDNHTYTRVVHLIERRENVVEELKDKLDEVIKDDEKT